MDSQLSSKSMQLNSQCTKGKLRLREHEDPPDPPEPRDKLLGLPVGSPPPRPGMDRCGPHLVGRCPRVQKCILLGKAPVGTEGPVRPAGLPERETGAQRGPAPPLRCCSAPGLDWVPAPSHPVPPQSHDRKKSGRGGGVCCNPPWTEPAPTPEEQFTFQSRSKILIKINLPQF